MTYLEKHDKLLEECLLELGDTNPNPSKVPQGFKIHITQPAPNVWKAHARISDGKPVSVAMVFPDD